MKVHVAAIGGHRLARTVRQLGTRHRERHELVESPEESDLVLLCGTFTNDFDLLRRDPLYVALGHKCAVYTGDDSYCPIAPGVYTSPRTGPSTLTGRVRSHAYASSFGLYLNEAVAEAGRNPVESRADLLFSFEGSATSRVRRRLFGLSFDDAEVVVRDTSSSYRHFDRSGSQRIEGQQRYAETMRRSRFVLCPRGEGTGTLRLFEAMSLGVAPVLLSDRYVLPRGPRWEGFLVRVRERDVSRLVEILRRFETSSSERGERAREAWLEWFSPEVLFDRLVDAASESLVANRRLEHLYGGLAPTMAGGFELRRCLRRRVGHGLHRLRRRRSGGGRPG